MEKSIEKNGSYILNQFMWAALFIALLQFSKEKFLGTKLYQAYLETFHLDRVVEYSEVLQVFLMSFLLLNFLSNENLVRYGQGLYRLWEFYENNRKIILPLFR